MNTQIALNTQITIEQLKAKATFLGARLTISDNSTCIGCTMPLTKSQEKDGLPYGDFVATPNYNTRQTNITLVMNFMNEWSEKCELRSQIKKKEVEEYVRQKLATDDLWAKKALLLIYSKQTTHEQAAGRTEVNNSVGFSGHDSEYLTSLAKQLEKHLQLIKCECPNLTENEQLKKAWLSQRQMVVLKQSIKKYWRQVINASDEIKLLRATKIARNVQQMALQLE